jgi:predicted metalloprotease with PDZ domain
MISSAFPSHYGGTHDSYQGMPSGMPKQICNQRAFRRCAWLAFTGAFAIFLLTATALAQSPQPIAYTVSLASPEQHLVEVQITLPPGTADRELQLPVWNALYQVRDFAQFINWIRAKDASSNSLPLTQINSSRWQIHGASNGATVQYQIYVDSFGPFGAQLNAHHAFFNLAQVLMYPVDARNSAMTVHFKSIPAGWHIATPLRVDHDEFSAENYDRLVDSPVEISAFHEADFDESGAHFRVIIDADPADYNSDKIVASVRKIVAAAISWMNDRPFDTYTFFYHFPRGPAGGGMEHAYSTAIDINADTISRTLYPVNAVTAHEFFHLWNVKRIRPQTLEPIDYTRENYTRALWFSEGVTSAVEETIQLRAGLIDEKQYLANVGDQISELEHRPAHLTQSAEASSLDAWLEGLNYYHRPERSISYYNKGELLGIMLDLAIRQASHNQASLREAMQWMNLNYAKKGRYFDDSNGVREASEAVCHCDLGSFFPKYVAATDEVPWDDFLRYVGLHVEQLNFTVADPGFVASRNFDGPMTVVAVTSSSEAEHAGLQIGEAITELQGKPAAEDSQQQLSHLKPGDMISLKVRSRRGQERELQWKVGSREETSYQVKDLDTVSAEQRAHRAAWLKGEAENLSVTSVNTSGPGATGK